MNAKRLEGSEGFRSAVVASSFTAMSTAIHRIDIAGLAASVFFNVLPNGMVKVGWRWNEGPKTLRRYKTMNRASARKVYLHYKAKEAK